MCKGILSIVAFLIVFFFSLTAAAQVVVTGPGIPPQPPVQVIVNPPAGTVSPVYTFANTSSTPINVTPTLSCPSNTVSFEIDSTPFTLAPGQSKQVAAFVADLPGGAGAGAVASCSIDSTVIIIHIIAPPPARSLLKIDLSLSPLSVSKETTSLLFDLETNLDLNIAIGDLTFRSDTGVGITGVEFQVFEFSAQLGDVFLISQYVFGTPFALPPIDNDGDGRLNEDPLGDANGDGCPGVCGVDDDGDTLTDEGNPSDDDEDGLVDEDLAEPRRAIGPLLLAKKRVTATLTISGLTIENLAILEDVNFPDPDTSTLTSYQASDQFFAFGDMIQVSGQTAGGVSFVFITGISVDPQQTNKIKKRFFPGKVQRDEKLGFTVEKIKIESLILGGIIFGSETVFRPSAPFQEILTLRFSLADLATVTAVASWTDISAPQLQGASIVIATPNIILITTLDANLNVTSQNAIATLSINGAIASTLFLTFVPSTGLTGLSANLVIPLSGENRLTGLIRFAGTPVRFQSTQFTLESKAGNIELLAAACFSASGLGGGLCAAALPGALITARIRF